MNKDLEDVLLAEKISDTGMLKIIGPISDNMNRFDGENSWNDTNHKIEMRGDEVVVSFDIPVMGGMDHLEFEYDSWQELLEKFIKKKTNKLTLVFNYE